MLEADIRINKRIIKFLNREVDLFVNYANDVLKLKYKLDPKPFDNDGESPWGVEFEDIYIFANEKLDKFEVGYGTYEPGSYWEPPSGDYVEYSNRDKIQDALFDVLTILLKWDYQGYLESKWSNECVEEIIKYGYEL